MKRLNKIQQKAAEAIYGSHMILAGAGTGKTELLAQRVENMVTSDAQIDGSMILALTYTDAGAVSMRQRLVKNMGSEAYKVSIHTFHSLCNDIIKSNPDYFGMLDMDLVSPNEQIEFLKQIVDEFQPTSILYRHKGDRYFEVKRLKALFEVMKNEDISFDMIAEEVVGYIEEMPNLEEFQYKRANKKKGIQIGDPKTNLIEAEKEKLLTLVEAASHLEKYNELLEKNARYDYADMIWFVIRAMEETDWVKLQLQEKYQFVLVDEMQDTSGSQFRFLELLMDFWDEPNLFIVGDLRQCIFEFSGARLKNILDFQKKYSPQVYELEENYRSGQSILNCSHEIIKDSAENMNNAKSLIASRLSPIDILPQVHEYGTIFEEEVGVVSKVEELIKDGVPHNEIAILYRKHSQGDNIAKIFYNKSIPVNIKKKANVMTAAPVMFVYNTLKMAKDYATASKEDRIRLITPVIFSKFSRISPVEASDFVFKLRSGKYHNVGHYDDLSASMAKILAFIEEVSAMSQSEPLLKVCETILEQTGLVSTINKMPDRYQQMSFIHTFWGFIKSHVQKDPDFSIQDLVNQIDLMHDNEVTLNTGTLIHDKEGVNMLTIHGAKGLEFSHVFMIGCTPNNWENMRGVNTKYHTPPGLNLRNEDKDSVSRRLFYVGMTRAKDELVISYSRHNNEDKELEPTRFIEDSGIEIHRQEILKDVSEYLANMIAPDSGYSDRVGKIEKSLFDEMFEDYHLSVSHMNKYLKCPVTFFFENVLKVPFVPTDALVYGNAVHRALRWAYEYRKDSGSWAPVEEFVEVFRKDMAKNRGNLSNEEYDRRLGLIPDVIKYYNEHVLGSNPVTLNEFQVKNITIDGIPFRGDFDKLEFDYNFADIVDYKTGKVAYTKAALRSGGDIWRQLVSYKLMLKSIYWKPWKFRSARVEMIDSDHMGPLPVGGLEITDDDCREVIKDMHTAYNGIREQKFSEGCGDENCFWCNLK